MNRAALATGDASTTGLADLVDSHLFPRPHSPWPLPIAQGADPATGPAPHCGRRATGAAPNAAICPQGIALCRSPGYTMLPSDGVAPC
jgi:hypothetical protein